MHAPHLVAFVGLSDTERAAVAAVLRTRSEGPAPVYALVPSIADAGLLIADAEHTPSVSLVLATERLHQAVWVGKPAPTGAVGGVCRPLHPPQLLRELDGLAARAGRPLARGTAAASAARPRTPEPPRALLVDDSELALRFLETRLQRWGLVLERAADSGRALALLAQRRFDFVFLDIDLGPGSALDGLALCQHIKRLPRTSEPGAAPGAPGTVVLVSAHASERDRVRGVLAGADAHLGKPLDEVELQRLLLRHGLKPRPAAAAG